MRKENPFLASIYPKGEKTCVACGTTNLAGERFHYQIWKGDHCPDCHYTIEDRKAFKQRQSYQSGEEEPSYTSEITCPWCGYEQSDSWVAEDSDDEAICGECNSKFSYERHTEITYCSSRVEESEDEEE